MDEKENQIKIEKILCPLCRLQTNHKKVWEYQDNYNDEENGFWEEITYEVLQCLGCETPILRKRDLFSENIEFDKEGNVTIIPEVTIWPKTSFDDLKIKIISNLPENVREIYRETIEAYNSKLPILCAAGIRAVIEFVCKEEKLIGDDLKKKIDQLKDKGIITESISEGLHQSRMLGNEALHDRKLFRNYELKMAIEMIETLLEMHYGSKDKTSILKSSLKK